MSPVANRPAYNCEIAVDPETGGIFRIALRVVEDGPSNPAILSGMVVEYAPVQFETRTSICPVHAIGIYTEPAEAVHRYVNDVTFTEYHLFGSESRMVPDNQESPK
jgi:hypothetical protein